MAVLDEGGANLLCLRRGEWRAEQNAFGGLSMDLFQTFEVFSKNMQKMGEVQIRVRARKAESGFSHLGQNPLVKYGFSFTFFPGI